MELLKRFFDVVYMLLNLSMTLCGFTFSFLELLLFFAFASILVLFIGGILR